MGVAVAAQRQNCDPRSAQISSSAEPTLQSEVLSKQTAAVDAVSGATYTSLTHEASPQSAPDNLGFKTAEGSTASTVTSALEQRGQSPAGYRNCALR